VRFGVHVRNDSRDRTPPLVRLKAVCGPGDHSELQPQPVVERPAFFTENGRPPVWC
jgi:hypothetical protein